MRRVLPPQDAELPPLALAGVIALVFSVYLRPQEIVPGLEGVPIQFLLLVLLVAVCAFHQRARFLTGPQVFWAGAFFAWAALTLLVRRSWGELGTPLVNLTVSFGLFLLLAGWVQTFRQLTAIATAVGAVCVFLSLVAVHQANAPKQCIATEWVEDGRRSVVERRACAERIDCVGPSAAPEAEYDCEHIGLFGTTTVGGRVRYRGIIADPNELALFVSIGLPFLFAAASLRRGLRWKLLSALAVALAIACLAFAKSRSGVLALVAVLGVYAVFRYRLAGVVVTGVLAVFLPLAVWRAGAGADQSTDGRLEAWSAAFEMFRAHPGGGVGHSMFTEHHYLTAHNSHLLVAAELGAVGLFLWSILLAVTVNTLLVPVRRVRGDPGARAARAWGIAMLASLAGLLVGMVFLSLAYHSIVWIYLGIYGAYFATLRRQMPSLQVRVGLRSLALASVSVFTILAACFAVLKLRGY